MPYIIFLVIFPFKLNSTKANIVQKKKSPFKCQIYQVDKCEKVFLIFLLKQGDSWLNLVWIKAEKTKRNLHLFLKCFIRVL